ncbi:hypothetical protein GCM10027161_17110 [Microbispora hainanensis]
MQALTLPSDTERHRGDTGAAPGRHRAAPSDTGAAPGGAGPETRVALRPLLDESATPLPALS